MGAHGKLRTFEIETDTGRLFGSLCIDLMQVKRVTSAFGLMQLNKPAQGVR